MNKSNQRLPGGLVSRGSSSGSVQPSGGGTKTRDAHDAKAQPNQSLPKGFSSGGQGEYRPSSPVGSRDYHGTKAQPNQKLPSGHWDGSNVSQGKAVGATRGADAYQGPRSDKDEADPTPRRPGG